MRAVAADDEIPWPPAGQDVDPLGDPFLRTRFVLPARPVTFLRRRRLVERLHHAMTTPLVLVEGAAGAGKTLLVADWAADLDGPVAWLTVDEGVRRPGMFWAHLIKALRTADVPLPDDIGFPSDGRQVDRTLLNRLAARLSGHSTGVTVVIDEYDKAVPEVSEQLAFVLHHAGPGLRLVLVTRTEPLLPLHRYRAAGELTEIRDADLAFTPEEAVELLEAHGLRLPLAAADDLVDRTRGWAAGLRLCALAARQSPDPELYLKEFEAGHSTVADFLLAEVLQRQPPLTQDLLLRVSVLERFCADLADTLTGRADAAPILAELHHANAFVEDLGHSWYRLHPLFREILGVHLRERCPGLEPELHRRAAHWLRRSGALPEMVSHGAAAGDWEFTARALVDDLAIGQLFTGLCSDDLAGLFAGMEPTTTPESDLVQAAGDLARHDLDRGLAHLRHAKEHLAAEDTGLPAAQLSCALLEALAARLSGSLSGAEQAARAARELQREVPGHLLDRHPELPALLLTHVGSARLWAGHLQEARAALTLVTGDQGGASTAVPRQESLVHLALIDYLDGWPDKAQRHVSAARAESERFSLPEHADSGLGGVVMAAVAVERDELERARTLLDQTPAGETPDPVTAAGRSLVTARLLLAEGKARAALAAAATDVPADFASPWAEEHTALVTASAHLAEGRPEAAADVLRELRTEQPACAVGMARAHLAAGDPSTALGVLDAMPGAQHVGPAVRVRATLVRAQAAHADGDEATARRLLTDALLAGRRDRLRRPFREAGAWITPLLARTPLRELAAGWLTPGEAAPGAGAEPAPVLVEPLSEREHDVLVRLARMMSTEEIAADLFVSVNTVKTHVKNLHRKLAVNRRTDAVRQARRLGLL
ncbi:helix-turn-helix transcriptional regulator [Streptomyces actuosus]|uniref:Helix-turn-helix transcriptional regulator n=1 Tax=Streptomyces actuosus TaxID=1885 RepID=A0A2U9NV32_STRAS|nr:helix-turn-helix transcriptional regulator [Streptomyces actuosus]MBM4826372.1 helix-turn-helix transcriptional regulator [Streptomyces actuosus]